MRLRKEITIYLPTNFKSDLDNYLLSNPPKFKYTNQQFYFLINYLITKHIIKPKEEYHFMDKKYLSSVIGSNCSRYIRILKIGEFIISDKEFIPNVKSLKYKLNLRANDKIHKVIITDIKLSQKIIKRLRLRKSHNNRLEPFLRLMNDKFMKLEFDYKGANKWVKNNAETNKKELSYLNSLIQLEDKRFRYFKRNKTNKRLDTNLTNLKSELRYFLKDEYISIDLKNSQPLLLGILINNLINNNKDLCKYLSISYLEKTFGLKVLKAIYKIRQKQENLKMATSSVYLNSVLKGVFYDEFITRYLENFTRKEVKDIMFKVLFSKNQIGSGYKRYIPFENEKKIFEKVYPLVYDIVKNLKSKDNKTLPIYLQKLESYIFIDCIAKELIENNIIPLTIHDSIVVEPKYKKKTIEIMNIVFKRELGIERPQFKIKPLFKGLKKCPITKQNISMQKDDSFLLSHTGLKHYYKTDKKVFEEVKRKYLSKKWFNRDIQTQIKEISHNIRNTLNNQRVKQKRLYPKY